MSRSHSSLSGLTSQVALTEKSLTVITEIMTKIADLTTEAWTIDGLIGQFGLSSQEGEMVKSWLDEQCQLGVLVSTPRGLRLNREKGYVVGYCHRKDRISSIQSSDLESRQNEFDASDHEYLMQGDWVLAKIRSKPLSQSRSTSQSVIRLQLVMVLRRAHHQVIGRIANSYGNWYLVPEDSKVSSRWLINVASLSVAGIVPNHGQTSQLPNRLVLGQIVRYPQKGQMGEVQLIKMFGDNHEPGVEIDVAVHKFQLPHEFSSAVLKELERLPEEVSAKDWQDRIDLTDLPFVTIDGEDARDYDDAVYCEPILIKRKKAYRLLVAIADVSHYVKPHSAIDGEAVSRGTSVYFPREVIPMLPEKLSNGLCSLNPYVPRCVLVCDMVIDSQGLIDSYQFYPGMICSAARLTYTTVATFLSRQSDCQTPTECSTEDDFKALSSSIQDNILNLNAVFKLLLSARVKRGAIDFDIAESKVLLDSSGRITGFAEMKRNDAHRLIEECMLAANQCAAELMHSHGVLGLYRTHEEAQEKKLEALKMQLRAKGIHLTFSVPPNSKELSSMLEQQKDRPDFDQLQLLVLRSMSQAIYQPQPIGHFGLAYALYTHFTSPIRRYSDLLVHRVIRGLLVGKNYEPSFPKSFHPLTLKTRPRSDHSTNCGEIIPNRVVWEQLGEHCSATERRAEEASRDVLAWLKCYYMQTQLGESFWAKVVSITAFGMFVQLVDSNIEGLLHISDLGNEYFHYDEHRHELISDKGHRRFGLLDIVRVKLVRVDLDQRRIDFVLETNRDDVTGASVTDGSKKIKQKKYVDQASLNSDENSSNLGQSNSNTVSNNTRTEIRISKQRQTVSKEFKQPEFNRGVVSTTKRKRKKSNAKARAVKN